MKTNTTPKFQLVLVTRSWNGKMTVKVKLSSNDAVFLKEELRKLKAHAQKCGHDPDYRICGPVQFKKLQAEVQANHDARRKNGAKKAAKTRARNVAQGAKPQFVCCPRCGAKSKKLYSEMGGLQTRRCQKGHIFTYDKWIADRAFWGPILGAGVPDPYRV